mgnify:CR=1 FL=1
MTGAAEHRCYTDGSCKPGDGAPGGWGFVIEPPSGPAIEGWGSEEGTLAKVMEYRAVAEALARLPEGARAVVLGSPQFGIGRSDLAAVVIAVEQRDRHANAETLVIVDDRRRAAGCGHGEQPVHRIRVLCVRRRCDEIRHAFGACEGQLRRPLLLEGSSGLQIRSSLQCAGRQLIERKRLVFPRGRLGCDGRHLGGLDAHQPVQVGQQCCGAASERGVLRLHACDLHGE